MSNKKPRFSKATVIAQLDKQIDYYTTRHGFHHRTGWAQVNKRGEEVNRDYGLWKYAVDLKGWIQKGEL